MIKELLIFAAGAGAGTAATYFVLNQKYKDIIDVEIQEIRESYDRRMQKLDEKAEEIVETKAAAKESANKSEDVLKSMASKYTNETETVDYRDFYKKDKEDSDISESGELVRNLFDNLKNSEESEDEEIPMDRYEIPPYAYFDDDQYEKRSFTLTSDHVLMDEHDGEVGDADNQIGNEILVEFINDPEETELYVRNDALETDYEVIKSDRSYIDFEPSEKEEID